MRRAAVIAIAITALAAVTVMIGRTSDAPIVDVPELASMAKRARVTWADYGEDIKAELGATPAARWHGAPVEARLGAEGITVRFELAPPWNAYDFGIPILLRDPEGRVAAPAAYSRDDSGGQYLFRRTGATTSLAVPWIEVRYPPNEERKLVFNSDGVWREAAAN